MFKAPRYVQLPPTPEAYADCVRQRDEAQALLEKETDHSMRTCLTAIVRIHNRYLDCTPDPDILELV